MTTRREQAKTQKPRTGKQQEPAVVVQKPETGPSVALEGGKFFLDIAKLVFGGVILAGIMQQGIEFSALFLTGLGVVILFTLLGFFFIQKSKKQ